MICRLLWCCLLLAGTAGLCNASEDSEESLLSKPTWQVRQDANVRVPMRDGVTLAADIFRPDAPGKFPAILVRTPYNRASESTSIEARWFAARGYVVIEQDVRGRYDSDGVFYAFKNETNDGYDTDEWLGKQPWFDGNLGTMGGSYVGYVQWAQAVGGSRYLKAMVPAVTTPDIHGNWIYTNGALHYGFALPWGGVDIDGHVDQFWADFDWPSIFPHLPVATSDDAAHHRTPHYRDWLAHPTRDSYWDGISLETGYNKIGVPILTIEGWYDIFLRGALQDDIQVRKQGQTASARTGKRLLIGPWAHSTGGRVALVNGRAGGAAQPDRLWRRGGRRHGEAASAVVRSLAQGSCQRRGGRSAGANLRHGGKSLARREGVAAGPHALYQLLHSQQRQGQLCGRRWGSIARAAQAGGHRFVHVRSGEPGTHHGR